MALKVGKDYVYLLVGVRCWGKGTSEKVAKTNARKEGGPSGVETYNLYLVPPSAYVNEMGDIRWNVEEGKPDHGILIKCVRGGKEVDIPQD